MELSGCLSRFFPARAAVAPRGGCDNRRRKTPRHCRIYRVTAALKDFDSCLGAKIFISSDHAVAGANSFSRPAPVVAGTVAEFGRSLAANRRRQAKEENTRAKRRSYSHGRSKTPRDSLKSVKAGL